MIITKITPSKTKKDLYSIYADDKFLLKLSAENLFKFGIEEGLNLDKNRLSDILIEEQNKLGLDFAVRLLTFRARSEQELRERLKLKGYGEETTANVIEKLKKLRYIDDDRFAREFAESLKLKQKGPRYIRPALLRKGIEPQVVEELLSQMYQTSDDEAEQIRLIAEKKLLKMKNIDARKASDRLMRFLVARGFSIENISRALRALKKEEY
jgi:regulatory protein